MKMAVGGRITQGFAKDPCGRHVWADSPEALLVFHPVTETRAYELGLIGEKRGSGRTDIGLKTF
jgi:hypothetical protein